MRKIHTHRGAGIVAAEARQRVKENLPKFVTIHVAVKLDNDRYGAILVHKNKVDTWIPRSLIKKRDKTADGILDELTLPRWFVVKNELY